MVKKAATILDPFCGSGILVTDAIIGIITKSATYRQQRPIAVSENQLMTASWFLPIFLRVATPMVQNNFISIRFDDMRYGNYTPFNAYQEIEKKINGEILAEKESFILGTSTDELTDYYFTNSCLTPLQVDNTRTETIDVKKEWRVIPSHLREVGYQSLGNLDFEFEIVIVTIPIKPHRQIEKLKQFADFNSYGNSFKWGQHTITVTNEMKGYGFNKDEDTVKNQIENAREIVYNWIYSLNTQISNLNESLKSNIRQWIELRKEKLRWRLT